MSLALQTFPTIKEASAALQAPEARYLGGGTLVVRAANEGDISIERFVRSTDPELSTIKVSEGRASIGASATMASVARHPDLAWLSRAARAVGGPAVRNQATVGGNLFAPRPYGDFAVALLALDARVDLGDKTVPIEAFLTECGAAHPRTIVASVSFDLPSRDSFRFVKVARVKPKGVSVLSIAAALEEKPDGTISEVRIALGCMADRPLRAKAAEKALIGKTRTEDGIAAALAVIGEGTAPADDAIASAWYRSEVLPVHFRRLLLG